MVALGDSTQGEIHAGASSSSIFKRPNARSFNRHCERSEAIHELQRERMDCFVASLLAMTSRYRLAFPPPDTPELCKHHSPKTEVASKDVRPLPPQPRGQCVNGTPV